MSVIKEVPSATRLPLALSKDQFVLEYQPVVDLNTGFVTGVEALLRWQRSDGSLLAPGDFIAIAEATGAIVPIGAWVIETACHKLAAWTLDGIDEPTLSINVSALHFRHGALLHDLKRALAGTGADPTRLTLEITETVLVSDLPHAAIQLRDGAVKGVNLARSFRQAKAALGREHGLGAGREAGDRLCQLVRQDGRLVAVLYLENALSAARQPGNPLAKPGVAQAAAIADNGHGVGLMLAWPAHGHG